MEVEKSFWNVASSSPHEPEDADSFQTMEEEFLWMEGRIPPPANHASTSIKNRFKVWCFLTDPSGPYTSNVQLSAMYATFSVVITFLYLVLYGISTSLQFRDSKKQGEELDPENCTSRLQCLTISKPSTAIAILLRILLCYFNLETVVKIVCCTNHKRYFKSIVNWIDIVVDILAILSIVFMQLAEMERNQTYLILETVFQGLQVFRIFRIFQVSYATSCKLICCHKTLLLRTVNLIYFVV